MKIDSGWAGRRNRTVPEYDESTPILNEDTIGHHCFGCGNLNPAGLRLRFRALGDEGVWATFTPARAHEGYMSMTHGGILATMLDEAMSWAVTATGDPGVTGRMSLAFRRPARIGEPLRVVGRVTRRHGRAIDTMGEIREVRSGLLVADADGRFVRVSKDLAAAWKASYGALVGGSAFGGAARSNPALTED